MSEGTENSIQDQSAPKAPESGGWGWGGFFSSLSTQAASLVEDYVSDIKEFGNTISHDTSVALESVAHRMESAASNASSSNVTAPLTSIKSGISNFVSGMSEMAQGVTQELGEIRVGSASPNLISSGPNVAQLQEKLSSADELAFKQWMSIFDVESQKTEISRLLAQNTSVLSLFQQLVPNELSYEEFWGRYFFKMDQAAKKEEQRAAILSKTKLMASKLSESEFSWDDDDDDNENGGDETKEKVISSPSVEVLPINPEEAQISSSIQVNEISEVNEEGTSTDTATASETISDVLSASISSPPPHSPSSPQTSSDNPNIQSHSAPIEDEDVFEWN